jgi:hypothetical protein
MPLQTNTSYEVEIGNLKKILTEINMKEQEILMKIQLQDTKSPIVDEVLKSPPNQRAEMMQHNLVA